MARSYILLPTGGVALILSVATAVLLYILTGSMNGQRESIPALPLVAAIVQTLSFVIWGFFVWRQFRLDPRFQIRGHDGLEKRPLLLFLSIGLLPVLLSAIVTGTALGWCQKNFTEDMQVSNLVAPTFLAIVFVVWGINVAVQVIHLIATAYIRKPHARPSQQRFSMGEGLGNGEAGPVQQMTEVSRPVTAETTETQPKNPFRETPSSSSPPSLIPSEGPSSLRSSFSTLPRPSSSKRGLIIRQPSFGLKHPRTPSEGQPISPESASGRTSHDEGFDSWDTSQVSMQIREALQASGKNTPLTKETRLTPIPGSRSPSPAKALEGPFFDQTPSEDTPPMSPLPQPSVSRPGSPPSSSPIVPNFTSVFPAAIPAAASSSSPTPPRQPPAGLGLKLMTAFPPGSSTTPSNSSSLANSPIITPQRMMTPRLNSRPGSRPLSRQSSCGEDHIHPLFRTTSPSPAPSPSLSTVITAAPEAGQLVDERALRSRMRKGSLPGISSPLLRSESSPDIRKRAVAAGDVQVLPESSSPPPPLPRKSSTRLHVHQRKRSASLETFLKKKTSIDEV